jgi:hypothetical protein
VVVAVIVIGGFLYFESSQLTGGYTAPTPGVTNTTQRIASINLTGGSGTPTTTANTVWCSLYNSDANDRVITALDFSLFGVETNEYVNLLVGTTTTAGSTTLESNFVSTQVSTSSPLAEYYSSSTVAANNWGTAWVWPTGSYLNWVASSSKSNGTTTTVANGICKASYMAE